MTDLLTKEERKEVDSVRHRWQHERSDSVDTGKILTIIDNLSKRGVGKNLMIDTRGGAKE